MADLVRTTVQNDITRSAELLMKLHIMQLVLQELRLLDYKLDGYLSLNTYFAVPQIDMNFAGYDADLPKRRPEQSNEDWDLQVQAGRRNKAAADMSSLARQLLPLVGRWEKDGDTTSEVPKVKLQTTYKGIQLVLTSWVPTSCKVEYEEVEETVPAQPEHTVKKRKVKSVDCSPVMQLSAEVQAEMEELTKL